MIFDGRFLHLGRIHLIWAAVAVVGVLIVLDVRRRGSLGAMLSPLMQRRLVVQLGPTRQLLSRILVLLALSAGILALARPQGRGDTVTVGSSRMAADVIVVLDVSKSMLAEDVAPSRLARARVEISKLGRQLAGDRLGLVGFAGRAVLLCPLTADHAFFDLVLSGVDTRSVSRGGTRIGDAVRTAVKAFPAGPGAKLIVLITDGEDHDSFPLDAAKEARDAGVRIVAVGLGSEDEGGSPIVITDPATGAKTTMMHDGVEVRTRLDGDTLRQMATTTEGVYVPAGTSALDLESIVREHVQPIVREATDASVRVVPTERYPWLVILAIGLLAAAVYVDSTAGRGAAPSALPPARTRRSS